MGLESGLLAGWSFNTPSFYGLNPWWEPSPRAYPVPVSVDRNSDIDDGHFESPYVIGWSQEAQKLPIPVNEEWYVVQGYNARGGSHNGFAAFCYDLSLYTPEPWAAYPNGTANAPVVTSGSGKAVVHGSGAVMLKHSEVEWTSYMHLAAGSLHDDISGGTYDPIIKMNVIPEAQAVYFPQGSTIAEVDPAEYHLHWMGKGGGLQTYGVPMAFTNYFASDDSGQTWMYVSRGHPKAGQVIKRLQ